MLTEKSNIYIAIQCVGKRPGDSFESSIIMKVCVFRVYSYSLKEDGKLDEEDLHQMKRIFILPVDPGSVVLKTVVTSRHLMF